MNWYQGPTVLETLALFKKEQVRSEQPLRFPLQDVYKFDARRILAGRITAGRLKVGDQLVFSPSKKPRWCNPSKGSMSIRLRARRRPGQSVGITLDEQIFLWSVEKSASHRDSVPLVSTAVRVICSDGQAASGKGPEICVAFGHSGRWPARWQSSIALSTPLTWRSCRRGPIGGQKSGG